MMLVSLAAFKKNFSGIVLIVEYCCDDRGSLKPARLRVD